MNDPSNTENKSKQFFYTICKYSYLFCSPNFWFEDLKVSKFASALLAKSTFITNILICTLIITECAALFTHKNLTDKQAADLKLFCVSHSIVHFNSLYLGYEKRKVQEILYKLVVKFKEVYNDPEVEVQMIKKAKIFSGIYSFFSIASLLSYGVDAAFQVFSKDMTFTTLITVWPNVTDKSIAAEVTRVIIYIVWWIFLFRLSAVFCLIIPATVCLNHQYKILCNYFRSLNGIFETNHSQEEKEKKYEEAFILGIKLHAETLSCTQEFQHVSKTVFGGQMILAISVLALLMVQMANSERTMANALAIISLSSSVCMTSGCLMWNAGDITEEAARLPTAMFGSGWHHCHKSTRRIRPMLVIAMSVSQKPVVLKTLGMVAISYSTYVTIVKTSYSVFSVMY